MTLVKKVKVICEIASAHSGKKTELFKLIDQALSTKADYLKFQIFHMMN